MTEWKLSSYHKIGQEPHLCAAVVNSDFWRRGGQCSRKRGFGPQQAFCKQHDPDAREARLAEIGAHWNAKREREAAIASIPAKMETALRLIADGDGDPHYLAAKVLAEIKRIRGAK